MIHSFVISYVLYYLCIVGLELLSNIHKNKGEFVTTWSYKDHEKIEELNVSKTVHYEKFFSLNSSLFRTTGQKHYKAIDHGKWHAVDNGMGEFLPYHKVLSAVNGESVKLQCAACWMTKDLVNVRWSLNESRINSKMDISDSKIVFEKDIQKRSIFSDLNIYILDNVGFGDYTCSMRKYKYIGEKI